MSNVISAETISPDLEKIVEADFASVEKCTDSERWLKENCSRIEAWQQAAQGNDPRGQVLLGLCFDFGQEVAMNQVEAVKWYRLAAEQGNARGQFNLGACYDNGEGVEGDKAEATKWYRLAAEQGNARGQFNLGLCYVNGQGVEESKEEAKKWFTLGAEQGDADAKDYLDKLLGESDDKSTDKEFETKKEADHPEDVLAVYKVRFRESQLLDPPGTVINSLGMKLVQIKPGKFMMGGKEGEEGYDDEEEQLHPVQITRPFFMGMFQVTQGEYVTVMGANPSVFHGKTRPVEHVNWEQAVEYCRKLSELPAEKAAGRVYRLPTEAEWEYACRAGTEEAFAFGDELTPLQANFCEDYVSTPQPTMPVGMYPPNQWGLHDMHGNIWEWCSDWFGLDYYGNSPQDDPKGPAKGTHHVLRGGSASLEAEYCRSATRGGSQTDGPNPHATASFERIGDFGLRVVCELRR